MSRGQWTASPKQELKKMSVEEIEGIRREIQEKGEILNNTDRINVELQSRSIMQKDINMKKNMLQRDEDLIARGSEKDRIHKEIQELEERVVPNMPSEKEMWAPLGTLESVKAVEKNREFHKKFDGDLQRLQSLKRRLEPDDPQSGNLELIRPRNI